MLTLPLRTFVMPPVAALLLALTGCSSSSQSMRLDDYKKQVAALFAAYNKDITDLAAEVKTQGTKEEVFDSFVAYATAGSARSARLLSDWDNLIPPDHAREVHAEGGALIQAYKDAFNELEQG